MPATPPPVATMSWTDARRIALRAQGIGGSRRTAVASPARSREALAATLARTQLLQIDSVSVFARAHHLPAFTRHGSWDTRVLDRAAAPGAGSRLREAFAHEAAYVDEDVFALLAFRRRRVAEQDWGALRRAAERSGHLLEDVAALLAEHGPLSAAAISRHLGDEQRGEGWGWRRTESQWVIEYLFRSGALDCVGRSPQFERLYLPAGDLTAAALADTAGPGPDPAPAIRELVRRAARAHGVADLATLADHFRLRVGEARPAVQELLAEGELEPVAVAHPRGELAMLRHRDAPEPAPLRAAALVSPFDPIAFHRPRLAALYDVDYRIGIYTPAAERTTGYYALPFLHGDRFPLRVDLRADRARGVLEVRGVHAEPLPHLGPRLRTPQGAVLEALAGELSRAARWQGLEGIEVARGSGGGELAAPLAELLAARAG